ncbi:MAG: carboxypeptidase regulatory-like domain-containing protein [Nanoarchaeota archaeon]
MNTKAFEKQYVYFLMLFIIVGASIGGLLLTKKYTGFVGTAIDSQAGTITAVNLVHKQTSAYWAGVFGLVFSQSSFNEEQASTITAGTISSLTLVFTCVDPNLAINEIYMSPNATIDFTTLRAGSTSMIDFDFLNLSDTTTERANNSFTRNESILLGGTNISNIPAVYTYVNDAQNYTYFFTGILNSSGALVLVTKVYANSATSFKGTLIDYQTMLPIFNSSTRWHFFADPYDTCPSGFGSGQIGESIIEGYVTESGSNVPIVNATVTVGGNFSFTNSQGFFNITTAGGVDYQVISIKEGYLTNITQISTIIGQTTTQNLTMAKSFGLIGPNATVSGYVKDSSTGSIISGALISVAGFTRTSNPTGNYSVTVSQGTNVIAAVASGYSNFVGNFSITGGQNLSFIINMTSAVSEQNGTPLGNGTVQGFAKDSLTNNPISNVTVTLDGISNLTNGIGFYNLSVFEGTKNLVATKSGYNNFIASVSVVANNITIRNLSMSIITTAEGVSNGTINGTVRTSAGAAISSATVTVAGRSDASDTDGVYAITNVPAGTHNLVATASGFQNYISEVNISASQNTVHSIIMEAVTTTGLGPGSGAGKGAGQGAGRGAGQGPGKGAGTGIQAQIQQPTEIVNYEVSVKRILKKLSVGNFITVPITITNYKDEAANIKFSIEGAIKPMSRLSRENMIVEKGTSAEIIITLLGNVDPGIYEGYFVISGDINKKIPIYVLVTERERLSVESLLIKLTPLQKKVSPGDVFKYTVDLQNLLSQEKYKVTLSYSVKGINNNRSLFLEKEDVAIFTSFSLLKSFTIPEDMPIGDYSLQVHADFLETSTDQSTIFNVAQPFYKYAVFGMIPVWMLALVLGTLSTGTFGFVVYKKKREDKKRYKIDIDYSQMPKAGPRSAYVGNIAESKNKTYFDLDLFQVHTVIAGSSGSGKSIVAQDMVEEALLKGVAVIVFDPNALWTGFLRRCEDKKLLGLYKDFGMKKTDAKAFNGNVRQITDDREMIEFKKFMKPGEINVFVINKLDTARIENFVSNMIKQAFHANLPESKELKYLLVYDGIHSLLPKFGGSGQVFVQIERATREFRKWGIGLILLSQVLSDFPPEVLANINTEVTLRTRDEGDLNRVKEKYGEKVLQSVVKAAVGAGVVQNSAYNKGKPYFVNFRPPMHGTVRISEEDLDNYNKFNREIEEIEYQLEQLEKDNIDIFDLKLELKLAQDKVKSGNFNMVGIYLDGLKPRVKAQWDKLGKVPKKREIKYFDENDSKSDANKAKQQKKIEDVVQDDGVSEAIKQAKERRGAAQKAEAEKENASQDNPETQVDELGKQITDLVGKKEKQKATEVYAKVQEVYKNAPKELKSKLLPKCIELQKVIKNG